MRVPASKKDSWLAKVGLGKFVEEPEWFLPWERPPLLGHNRGAIRRRERVVAFRLHAPIVRAALSDGQLYLGSRSQFTLPWQDNAVTRLAERWELALKLESAAQHVFYLSEGRVFDVYCVRTKSFLRWNQVCAICLLSGLRPVDVIYEGEWDERCLPPSTLVRTESGRDDRKEFWV